MDPAARAMIDEYRIIRFLGSGYTSKVYLGVNDGEPMPSMPVG